MPGLDATNRFPVPPPENRSSEYEQKGFAAAVPPAPDRRRGTTHRRTGRVYAVRHEGLELPFLRTRCPLGGLYDALARNIHRLME